MGTTIELNEYQSNAESTAIYPGAGTDDGITYTILGLVGEAGELGNKWKKYFRDDISLEDTLDIMRKELGDVLWYVALAAAEFGVTLEEVAQQNLAKLAARQQAGTLSGNGDHR